MAKAEITLYLVRHGQTDYPVEEKFYSSDSNLNLNKIGREQVLRISSWFQDISGISHIYASSARRAIETAEAISGKLNLDYEVIPELQERFLGELEGKSFTEVKERYPDDWENWKNNNPAYRPSGGESLNEFCQRIKKFTLEIIDKHKGKKIILVTHAGPIRCLLYDFLQIPDKRFSYIYPNPSSVTCLEFYDKKPYLSFFGYLPPVVLE